MNTVRKVALAATLSAAVIAACSDSSRIVGPSAPQAFPGAQLNVMGACITIGALNNLAAPLFGAGSPSVNSVLGKLDNLRKKVEAGNTVDAQAQANNIVDFVRAKAAEGRLVGTQAQVAEFISGVLCYAGLSPDTFLILPTDQPQVRVSNEGTSGVSLEGSTVDVPTLLTLTTLDPNGPSPLITKLDQYPSYVSITVSSPLSAGKSAIVAVCPVGVIPPNARLRLGHQAAAGFEITPDADGSFLPCGTAALRSALPSWAKKIASLFTPKLLYAATFGGGGVGGSVTEFSPFGAVDTELGFSGGGVGGSATEFIRTQPTSPKNPRISAVPNGTANSVAPKATVGIAAVGGGTAADVDCSSATVGTELPASCRPSITITTHNGTPFEGVPVAWAVTAGGGTIAPNTASCGTFGSTASTTTDAAGHVSICWTLGPEGGTNTATATPSVGGDAPAGVTFKPARLLFTATALKITPTATAEGGSFVFDNAAHAGIGTCSNGLTPVLTYSSTTAPVTVGNHTLTVTCGEGSNVYNTVTATATISITAATPSVSVMCPASVVYDGTAQTPCSATVTAPGLSLTPTPDYLNNTNVGTATASVTLTESGNYTEAFFSATFGITPAPTTTAVSCPVSETTFTGAAIEPCTTSTTGPVNGSPAIVATPGIVYTNNLNAGTASATASFATGGNYLGSTNSATFTIAPAPTNTMVSCPESETFTGDPIEPCTATTTYAGLNATPTVIATPTVTYTDNTDAGTAVANAVYPYVAGGNHTSSSGFDTFTIDKAASLTTVTCTASVTYNGLAQTPCTAKATGVGGLNDPLTPITYTNNTNAGTAHASASFAGDANHFESDGGTDFAIDKAASLTTVTCTAPVVYNGSAQTPCTAKATGVGGLDETVTVVTYTNNTNVGTAHASASYAGDANHSESGGGTDFAILKAASLTTVTCTAPVVYNGGAQTPCTAKATGVGGLDETLTAITYTNNTNAGTAQASASYAGGANWESSSHSPTFAITQLSATATAGSATINFGSAVPTMPCTVSGLLSADAGSVTCTTTVPAITFAGTYTTLPAVSPSVNYSVTPVNGTLTVAGYVQVSCFSSPIYNVMPPSKSAQRKGSNLPVKCGLTTPQGAPVTNAHGNLVVVDVGTVLGSPNWGGPVAFSGNDVFKYSTGGNYAYGLDTSPALFVAGHYYFVTATWNDGSKSQGYFLLK